MDELERKLKLFKFGYYWCCGTSAFCGFAFIMELIVKNWLLAAIMFCITLLIANIAKEHRRNMKLIATEASLLKSKTIEGKTITN